VLNHHFRKALQMKYLDQIRAVATLFIQLNILRQSTGGASESTLLHDRIEFPLLSLIFSILD
jgi:hypothetical protein